MQRRHRQRSKVSKGYVLTAMTIVCRRSDTFLALLEKFIFADASICRNVILPARLLVFLALSLFVRWVNV